jgi:hypothetical protein
MLGQPQTMVQDLRSQSRQALRLENRFNLKKRVVLISTIEIDQIFRSEDKMGWNRFRQYVLGASGNGRNLAAPSLPVSPLPHCGRVLRPPI